MSSNIPAPLASKAFNSSSAKIPNADLKADAMNDKIKLAMIIIELALPIAHCLTKAYMEFKDNSNKKAKAKQSLASYKIQIKEKYKMSGESKEMFIKRMLTEVESEIRSQTFNGIDTEEEIEDAIQTLKTFMYVELKEEATRTTFDHDDAHDIYETMGINNIEQA